MYQKCIHLIDTVLSSVMDCMYEYALISIKWNDCFYIIWYLILGGVNSMMKSCLDQTFFYHSVHTDESGLGFRFTLALT